MDAPKQSAEFLDVIHTKVLKYYKVQDLTQNLSNCFDEIASFPTSTVVNIHGGLPFHLQRAVLKSLQQHDLPFVIHGRKFNCDPEKNTDTIAVILTKA